MRLLCWLGFHQWNERWVVRDEHGIVIIDEWTCGVCGMVKVVK